MSRYVIVRLSVSLAQEVLQREESVYSAQGKYKLYSPLFLMSVVHERLSPISQLCLQGIFRGLAALSRAYHRTKTQPICRC